MIRFWFVVITTIVFGVGMVAAQGDRCPPEVDFVLDTVEDHCETLGRNQVCYGNHQIDIEQTGSEDFSSSGDVISVHDLVSLQTHPLSLESGRWGIAVLSIQANLPDTLPGQNVILIVFGNTEIYPDEAARTDYTMPMQAIYLQTGIGVSVCNSIPEGGVLVQNPREYPAHLMVNGLELRIGSTALLTAADTDTLTIATLEGNVQVTSAGLTQDIPSGFTLTVSRDNPPEIPVPDSEVEVLLAELLPEAVPLIGEPDGDITGLLVCANSGGVDVAAGSTVALRGGWATYELADLIEFAATTPPTLDYDGTALPYGFRSGPAPWTGENGTGYRMDWFWIIENVEAGSHQATWFIGGQTLVCQIRAN